MPGVRGHRRETEDTQERQTFIHHMWLRVTKNVQTETGSSEVQHVMHYNILKIFDKEKLSVLISD